MHNPKHHFSSILVAVILVTGVFLLQPSCGLAATAYQLQPNTKIYVDVFRAAETVTLPSKHSHFAAQLTEAIRKQLDDERRLQADPRLPALKLVGLILSYQGNLLDVQVELYDGNQYLAYSRVERLLDPASDWEEDGELIAEQLLDELMSQIRRPAAEQVIAPSPWDCNGYSPQSVCNDIFIGDWGWWRHHAHEHRPHGAMPQSQTVKHPGHDKNPRHEHHHEHAAGEHHRHTDEKRHWIADAPMGHHHKSQRIEGAISATGQPQREIEPVAKPDGVLTQPENSKPQSDAGSGMERENSASGRIEHDLNPSHRESHRGDGPQPPNANPHHARHSEQPLNTTLQAESETPRAPSAPEPEQPVISPNGTDSISSEAEPPASALDAVTPAASPASRSLETTETEDSPSGISTSDSAPSASPSPGGYSSGNAATTAGSSSSTAFSSDSVSPASSFANSTSSAPSTESTPDISPSPTSGYSSDSTAVSEGSSSPSTSFSTSSDSSSSSFSDSPAASTSYDSTPSSSAASSSSSETVAPAASPATASEPVKPDPVKPEPEKPAQPADTPPNDKP